MNDLHVTDIRPFIGSKDFDTSRDFYTAIGWNLNWDNGNLAELELGGSRLYLQAYYQRKWCENSMLHVTVRSAQAWYDHVKNVLGDREYGAARIAPPKSEDYGALVTYIWDPVGILLHMAEPIEPSKAEGS